MRWWKLPLSGEPYRYTLFLLLSLPTLAGAWAVHALGGIALWLLVPWVLGGYTALWRRIAGT